MPDWSIRIVTSTSGTGADFVPALMDAQPGQPLLAYTDDMVSWNNRTNDPHHPWPANEDYEPYADDEVDEENMLADEIPPRQPSQPAYLCGPAGTIYYVCKLHPEERGSIIVKEIGA